MVCITDSEFSSVKRFVNSFEKLDEMCAGQELDPVAWQLAVGKPDQYGFKRWRPINVSTRPEILETVYEKLPARFPPLYECLILTYRWAEVDLKVYRLFPNPPEPNLNGLLAEILKDSILSTRLLLAGYIQFGMGPDTDYDPVCFGLNSQKRNGDYRIVLIDHEEILCNDRVKVVAELAPTFEGLMLLTINSAKQG
jgi:hypothetical protein